ncbi:rhodanese-like domain-containing protein [Lysinibacillus sphaericus]|uniref:Rhodanese-like domain-containing protein n=4 Tax=Lysinibacillus TaxID=400634 RepID=A0A4U2YFF8_9BACI|nr:MULTISPECIES: rhodanese-like domain-containing protein [Lysinibacillus]AHN23600.1 rhodanese [Lysinibacillus varians]AVK95159.1 rhodanese [Lysinibacillus sphaericus]MCS1381746.1 rhodanese-like domain-containing protein [Lysinibacillus sphaericus]MED4544766.1 rhodanese-like domain-containing protein [Lysinibacillus sphaericus]OEC03677.1 rhodanese [Lysinibacillus sphaericus]
MEAWIMIAIVIGFLVWRMKPAKGVQSISTAQLKNVLNDKDKVFIDVRTPAEYKGRNIPQFKNIPLGSSFDKIPKDKEVVVICQSGMRSSQACKQLKKLGYERVTNVRGGMSAY